MKGIGRIGRGGAAALAAGALAAGAIGYRLLSGPEAEQAAPMSVPGDPLAELQRRANAEPGNAGAWQQLGFAWFERGRFGEAAEAYRRATGADPESAVLWSSLGEALVMASERDPMPAGAREAFAKALALDAKDPRARYFRAVEKDLADDHAGAIADWLALLADTPAGAPWEADLVRTIEQVGTIRKIPVSERIAAATAARPSPVPAAPVMAGIPGPSREEIAAAAAIPPGEQREMAEGMVARLADRLKREPGDVDGWIMLVRSYQTLGQPAQAKAARDSGIAANPGARTRLEDAARALGVN